MSEELERLTLELDIPLKLIMFRVGAALRTLLMLCQISNDAAFKRVHDQYPEIDWDEFHGLKLGKGDFKTYANAFTACGFTLEHVREMLAHQIAGSAYFAGDTPIEPAYTLSDSLSRLVNSRPVKEFPNLDDDTPKPAAVLHGYLQHRLTLGIYVGDYLGALTDQQRRYYLRMQRNEMVDSRGYDRNIYPAGHRNFYIGEHDISAQDFQSIMASAPFADGSVATIVLQAALWGAQINADYQKLRNGTDAWSLERKIILSEVWSDSGSAQEVMSRAKRNIEATQSADRSLQFPPGESMVDIMTAVTPIVRGLSELLGEINNQQQWTELIAALSDDTPNSLVGRTAFETLHSWEQRLATLFASL